MSHSGSKKKRKTCHVETGSEHISRDLERINICLYITAQRVLKLSINKYVIVKFGTSKKLLQALSWLRTKDKKSCVFPKEPHISDVNLGLGVLPTPVSCRRVRIIFGIDLTDYKN